MTAKPKMNNNTTWVAARSRIGDRGQQRRCPKSRGNTRTEAPNFNIRDANERYKQSQKRLGIRRNSPTKRTRPQQHSRSIEEATGLSHPMSRLTVSMTKQNEDGNILTSSREQARNLKNQVEQVRGDKMQDATQRRKPTEGA